MSLHLSLGIRDLADIDLLEYVRRMRRDDLPDLSIRHDKGRPE
jgi:hypothetical protein